MFDFYPYILSDEENYFEKEIARKTIGGGQKMLISREILYSVSTLSFFKTWWLHFMLVRDNTLNNTDLGRSIVPINVPFAHFIRLPFPPTCHNKF